MMNEGLGGKKEERRCKGGDEIGGSKLKEQLLRSARSLGTEVGTASGSTSKLKKQVSPWHLLIWEVYIIDPA